MLAAAQLNAWKRPLLVSHAKPDGDAIGSLLALRNFVTALGARPRTLLFDPLPRRFETLADPAWFVVGDAASAGLFDDIDGVVIADTCSFSQLEPIAPWLKTTSLPRLVIDHHSTRDPVATVSLIDESAAATCLIIYELARRAGWPIDAATATYLYVGISTDTGWFRHSNTDARAMHAAADLLTRGVRAYQLFEALYQQDASNRIRLLSEALCTLDLHYSDQLAIMTLSRDAFRRTGAVPADTEDIVNEPLRIASVVASVLFVEQDDGLVRINFRSKAPDPQGRRPDVDVAAIAKGFAGGGHRHASGARSRDGLAMAREKVLDAFRSLNG